MSDEPATKNDLTRLKADLDGKIDKLDGKIDRLEVKLDGKIDKLEVKLELRMDEMETRLSADMARHSNATAEHVLAHMKVLLEPFDGLPRRVDDLAAEAETVGTEIEGLDAALGAHVADVARHVPDAK